MRRTRAILGVAFVALLGFALTFSIIRARQIEIDDARTNLTSLVALLAEHGDRSIQDGDKLVRAVLGRVQAWDLIELGEARSIMEFMRELLLGSPQVASGWVLNKDGVSVLDTWSFPPTPVQSLERRYMQAHLAGEKGPLLAEQETGTLTKKPRFTVSRAVYDDAGIKAVVVAAIYSEYFSKLYSEAIQHPGARAGIYLKQPNGPSKILARLGTTEPASQDFLVRLNVSASGAAAGASVFDDRLVVWRALDSHKDAFASASFPLATINKWRERALELGLLYLFLAMAFIGILQMLHRVHVAKGESEYRAVLLEEVNHRVKNVMQILQAMIYSRSRAGEHVETRTALGELSASITAMGDLFATIQYNATTREINLSAVLIRVCESLERATGRRIAQDIEPVSLTDHPKATNITIIVNELITNAIKHSQGEVWLSVKPATDNSVVIKVSGRKSAGPSPEKPKSSGFGLKMVARLVSEIGATIDQADYLDRVSVELRAPL
jgi:two-component sensor histidine kinase